MADSDIRHTTEGGGVVVRDEADPLLRNVSMRWGRREGAVFEHGARGTMDGCTVQRNHTGVRIKGPGGAGLSASIYETLAAAASDAIHSAALAAGGAAGAQPSSSSSAPLSSAPFSQLASCGDTHSLAMASRSAPVPPKPLLHAIGVCDSIASGIVIESGAHVCIAKCHVFDNINGPAVTAHADARGIVSECQVSTPSGSSTVSSDAFLLLSEESNVTIADSNTFRKGVSPSYRGLTRKMRDDDGTVMASADDALCAAQRQHFSEGLREVYEWGDSYLGSMALGHMRHHTAMDLLVSAGVMVGLPAERLAPPAQQHQQQTSNSDGFTSIAGPSLAGGGSVSQPQPQFSPQRSGSNALHATASSSTNTAALHTAFSPLFSASSALAAESDRRGFTSVSEDGGSASIFRVYTVDVVEEALTFLRDRVEWSIRMGDLWCPPSSLADGVVGGVKDQKYPFFSEILESLLAISPTTTAVAGPTVGTGVYSGAFWSVGMAAVALAGGKGWSSSSAAAVGVASSALSSVPNACRLTRREWARQRITKALALAQTEIDRLAFFQSSSSTSPPDPLALKDFVPLNVTTDCDAVPSNGEGKKGEGTDGSDNEQLRGAPPSPRAVLCLLRTALHRALEKYRTFHLRPFIHHVSSLGRSWPTRILGTPRRAGALSCATRRTLCSEMSPCGGGGERALYLSTARGAQWTDARCSGTTLGCVLKGPAGLG